MPRYVIDRDIPDAGSLTQADLQGIAQKSCNVLSNLGPEIQWIESYVTENRIYCIYQAPDKEMIKKHAEMGGFPANRIEEIKNVISPVTAETTLTSPN